jgi:hypothetical protein
LGSYSALRTRDEIEVLLTDLYGQPGEYKARMAGPLEHLAERMRELSTFVFNLPTTGRFDLVVEEF